jgi:hypothetical protein
VFRGHTSIGILHPHANRHASSTLRVRVLAARRMPSPSLGTVTDVRMRVLLGFTKGTRR